VRERAALVARGARNLERGRKAIERGLRVTALEGDLAEVDRAFATAADKGSGAIKVAVDVA